MPTDDDEDEFYEWQLKLFSSHLLITDHKNNKKKRVIDLRYIKCYWLNDFHDPDFQGLEDEIGIVFHKNGVALEAYANVHQVHQWRDSLRDKVLLCDIHDEYEKFERIGNGNFGVVGLFAVYALGVQMPQSGHGRCLYGESVH